MIDPEALLQRALPTMRQAWTTRETILYALAVGAGQHAEAWDETQLRFLYEPGLQALPTLCAVLGDPGFWMREPDSGLDWRRLVHGEESVRWLRPLPAAGEVVAKHRICRVADRGAERGAVFVVERQLEDARTGQAYSRAWTTVVARGDGGFSPPGAPLRQLGEAAEDALPPLPTRAPDVVVVRPILAHQSLLYRQLSDLNPLHVEPAAARSAGFERPILHGMCSFGVMGLLLVNTFCGAQPERLLTLRARFTAPLYPGETLACEFWRDAQTLRFRATARERETVVLNQGWALVQPDAE